MCFPFYRPAPRSSGDVRWETAEDSWRTRSRAGHSYHGEEGVSMKGRGSPRLDCGLRQNQVPGREQNETLNSSLSRDQPGCHGFATRSRSVRFVRPPRRPPIVWPIGVWRLANPAYNYPEWAWDDRRGQRRWGKKLTKRATLLEDHRSLSAIKGSQGDGGRVQPRFQFDEDADANANARTISSRTWRHPVTIPGESSEEFCIAGFGWANAAGVKDHSRTRSDALLLRFSPRRCTVSLPELFWDRFPREIAFGIGCECGPVDARVAHVGTCWAPFIAIDRTRTAALATEASLSLSIMLHDRARLIAPMKLTSLKTSGLIGICCTRSSPRGERQSKNCLVYPDIEFNSLEKTREFPITDAELLQPNDSDCGETIVADPCRVFCPLHTMEDQQRSNSDERKLTKKRQAHERWSDGWAAGVFQTPRQTADGARGVAIAARRASRLGRKTARSGDAKIVSPENRG